MVRGVVDIHVWQRRGTKVQEYIIRYYNKPMCTHRHIDGASVDSSMGLWHKASGASPLAELAQLALSGWLAYSPTALPATYGRSDDAAWKIRNDSRYTRNDRRYTRNDSRYTRKWPVRVLHGAKMGILPLFLGCVVHENAHFM